MRGIGRFGNKKDDFSSRLSCLVWSDTKIISMERIGEGIHGVAYLVRFASDGGEKRLIIKTLFLSEFGRDHLWNVPIRRQLDKAGSHHCGKAGGANFVVAVSDLFHFEVLRNLISKYFQILMSSTNACKS